MSSTRRRSLYTSPSQNQNQNQPSLSPYPNSPRSGIPPTPRPPRPPGSIGPSPLAVFSSSAASDSPFSSPVPPHVRRFGRNLRAGKSGALLGVFSFVAAAWFIFTKVLRQTPPIAPCYALQAPGRLLVNLTHPAYTHWRPFDEDSCPALPLYIPALWALSHDRSVPPTSYKLEDYPEMVRLIESDPIPRHLLNSGDKAGQDGDAVAFLKKWKGRAVPPTVLILGDSVDRNGLTHFCQLMGMNVSISLYEDINSHPPDVAQQADLTKGHGARYKGWDQRGLPHMCEVPFYEGKGKSGEKEKIAVRVVNGFHYGMDALDEFDTPEHVDWHKPGKMEDRIDKLFVPLMTQLGGVEKVDLIIVHSGMWDLALFGLQDDKTNWSLTVPLTAEQLAWWQDRMRHTIYHLRETFPQARIVMRKLHRTDDVVAGTQYITNRTVSFAFPVFQSLAFCPLSHIVSVSRVHQLRHLQDEVARVEGLPVFDFGRLLEGYQGFQEKVHPLLVPGGVVYSQSILHQLRLALDGFKR